MSHHRGAKSPGAKRAIGSIVQCEEELNQSYRRGLLEAARQTQDNWRGELQKAIIRNINQSLSKSSVRNALQLRTIGEAPRH